MKFCTHVITDVVCLLNFIHSYILANKHIPETCLFIGIYTFCSEIIYNRQMEFISVNVLFIFCEATYHFAYPTLKSITLIFMSKMLKSSFKKISYKNLFTSTLIRKESADKIHNYICTKFRDRRLFICLQNSTLI
jgi:hypothetical protein